ncbi:hypothetical protein [Sphingobium sp. TCM1]|uniref:hypothetical protein n=1 Tax=Sphingobium sp. TCM1 TaxID=453246 RepID=UPI0007F46759|nr:hypothetical protein [Sphingobium sp. TCM1]OAN53494.1 hypothetical protein A7Q26_05590 [Sphingobium sp. TCM1]
MSADLFRRIADAEGWSDVTQIGILLRFIAAQRDRASFFAFLTQTRAATTDSDLDRPIGSCGR